MSKETNIPHLVGKKGYVVDEQIFANAKCETLELHGIKGDWSDKIDDNLDSALLAGGFSFAVLHNITLEDEETIVRTLQKGIKVLFQATSATHTLELQQMYIRFVKFGAVEVPRRAMIGDLLPILEDMFNEHGD